MERFNNKKKTAEKPQKEASFREHEAKSTTSCGTNHAVARDII